jgi:hypothetical protein
MSTSEPLVRLGSDSGKAPVISYNVPEPTSYSGRNFIELKFENDKKTRQMFKAEVLRAIDRSQRVQTFRQGITLEQVEAAMKNGFYSKQIFPHVGPYAGLIRLVQEAMDSKYKIVSSLPLSPELSQLHPQEVFSALNAQKSLMIYQSTFGNITYEYITPPQPLVDQLASSAITSSTMIGIQSPQDGSTITGPSSGAPIEIRGLVLANVSPRSDEPIPVNSVTVQIDQQIFDVTWGRIQDNYVPWSLSTTINSEGNHRIIAKAKWDNGKEASDERNINVDLIEEAPRDITNPTIGITSPQNGSTITGPSSGVPIKIEGTASDETGGSGLKKVQMRIDTNGEFKEEATLDQATGKWSFSNTVTTEGSHTYTVRAEDNAGNKSDEQSISIQVSFIADSQQPVSRRPRLFLIENYRLSSYLGQYGAGRTIKTFSLLPGEKTKISVKTYLKTAQQAKEASSILDSVTSESTKDFETSLGKEQSDKKNYQESSSYEISGKAEASWGWGSAEVSGNVKGGTNASREQFGKNVSNCTQKHASKASAKRDVQVNTSFEKKEEAGEETAMEREIENINVSRTLNFVFRQMNQEFITLLHLTDVRIAFWDGDPDPINSKRKEVPLFELQSLLDEFVKKPRHNEVRNAIINQLDSIFDYKGNEVTDFIEEVTPRDSDEDLIPDRKYWRVNTEKESIYKDETGNKITVPGIIISSNKYVMRTDGVIVEALLGQGDALDAYSHGLQDEAVRSKQLSNNKDGVAIEIVKDKDAEAAKIFEQVFPCCKPPIFSLWPPKDNDKENG